MIIIILLRNLLADVGHPNSGLALMKSDSKATSALLQYTIMQSSCVKHIDNGHHQCRAVISFSKLIDICLGNFSLGIFSFATWLLILVERLLLVCVHI